MSMNGIDISNWQKGIDLTKVPCDFVIIKATQGTDYVNPDYDRAYQQAKMQEKERGGIVLKQYPEAQCRRNRSIIWRRG